MVPEVSLDINPCFPRQTRQRQGVRHGVKLELRVTSGINGISRSVLHTIESAGITYLILKSTATFWQFQAKLFYIDLI